MNDTPEEPSRLKNIANAVKRFTRSWTFFRPLLLLLLALCPIFGMWLGGTLFQGNFFGSWLVFAIIAVPASLSYLYFIETLKSKTPTEGYHLRGIDGMAFLLVLGYFWLLIGAPIRQKEEFVNDMHCLLKTQWCNQKKYRLDNIKK
jgi:uncharacterized membrane protein